MKLIAAFFKLIRWPNLVFIALTQLLFHFCIYQPLFGAGNLRTLGWIVMASVLIAAAGYIINDYFDLNIDQVNKPQKNVFSNTINRRWAILWHFTLSLAGLFATAMASGLHKWYIIIANAGCILLLWFYSTSLKRSLLVGNFLISLLTAWTVLILFFLYTDPSDAVMAGSTATVKLFRAAFLYGGFAFIISLIREAVKDMEDLEGDARYGCRTLPIVAGLRTTKIYVAIWTVVLLAALVILQLYVLLFGWWVAVAYSVALIIAPLIYFLARLSKASSSTDFHSLSNASKLIMFSGIFSMLFFHLYF